jgi:hypothetical protein
MLYTPQCDDGSLQGDSPLLDWAQNLAMAASNMNRPINLASQYQKMLTEAGFTEVQVIAEKWPTNCWAEDSKMKELGRWTEMTLCQNLEDVSMALFTHGLNWTPEEVRILCTRARKEFRNRKVHAYFPFITAYGKKP